MALSYPLTMPSTPQFRSVTFRARSVVGRSVSPFTLEQQVYAHSGEGWEADFDLPRMTRAQAEAWIAWLTGLNGFEGTFLVGDPLGTAPQGTWSSGAPVLDGAHAAGVKTLSILGCEGLTWTAGDWVQIGAGASAHLHKVVESGSQSADSPTAAGTVEIWPRTRSAYADGQPITVSSAKGLWRLASNTRQWSLEEAQLYGVAFSAVEAL